MTVGLGSRRPEVAWIAAEVLNPLLENRQLTCSPTVIPA